MISTTDAEVDAVGDSLDYMYLFESSSASDSDARPYSFTVSSMQAVASTDSTVALHTDEKVHVSGGGLGEWGSDMELGKNTTQYWSPDQYSGVILDRVSFHGRFVHFHLPSFLYGHPKYLFLRATREL